MMNRRALMSVSAAALVAGGAWWLSRPAPGTDLLPGAAQAQEATGTMEITDVVLGNPDAAVEIIEYASFTCPHCASFHANQFKDLKANYIDTGLIRFIYREVYFDRPGLWASMVARCAGEDRFHGVTNLIYEQQQDWARESNPAALVEKLKTIGRTAGMTDEVLDACMQDAGLAQSLVSWYEANRDTDGVNSTPTLIINGEKHGNMAYPELAALIDAALAEADG